MRGKPIKLFMWAYQSHFRFYFQILANNVIQELGVPDAGAECLLVGARIPDHSNPNDVCVEPEDGKWPLQVFNGLLDSIGTEIAKHPARNIIYGDEPSMRDKPENIRQDSVRRAVQKALAGYDSAQNVQSFAGPPAPVGDYHVVPVLQIPSELFSRFRPLPKPVSDGLFSGHASLIHAALAQVLAEAHDELLRPEPGRFLPPGVPAGEIARRAATSFMYMPAIALKDRTGSGSDLYGRLNMVSSLMYEGAKGTGRLLLANPASGSVDLSLEFVDPVPFRQSRWARKVLEMASSGISLVADCDNIFGLGKVASGVDPWATQDVFQVDFLDHYHWRLSCGDEVMLISKYGIPSLPQPPLPVDRMSDTYERLFRCARPADLSRFIKISRVALHERHGTTLVVAADAEDEAARLQRQGARIDPIRLTPELFGQVSSIDGAILLDPQGVCYAVGVILDGPARPECTPARGSRYNSAIRYVHSTNAPRLAVVVSDDRTLDVIPLLHPRIKPSAIRKALAELESATKDDYHAPIRWLDDHRFYLGQSQCERVNAALKKIESEPREVGELLISRRKFVPDPGFDESYLEVEDAA